MPCSGASCSHTICMCWMPRSCAISSLLFSLDSSIMKILNQDFKCGNQSKYKIYSGILMNYWMFGGPEMGKKKSN